MFAVWCTNGEHIRARIFADTISTSLADLKEFQALKAELYTLQFHFGNLFCTSVVTQDFIVHQIWWAYVVLIKVVAKWCLRAVYEQISQAGCFTRTASGTHQQREKYSEIYRKHI
jgi:hypothetical protein